MTEMQAIAAIVLSFAVPFAVLIPTAVIMRRLCSDPRFARWLDEQRQ